MELSPVFLCLSHSGGDLLFSSCPSVPKVNLCNSLKHWILAYYHMGNHVIKSTINLSVIYHLDLYAKSILYEKKKSHTFLQNYKLAGKKIVLKSNFMEYVHLYYVLVVLFQLELIFVNWPKMRFWFVLVFIFYSLLCPTIGTEFYDFLVPTKTDIQWILVYCILEAINFK